MEAWVMRGCNHAASTAALDARCSCGGQQSGVGPAGEAGAEAGGDGGRPHLRRARGLHHGSARQARLPAPASWL